jgi:hypothetical protein
MDVANVVAEVCVCVWDSAHNLFDKFVVQKLRIIYFFIIYSRK